MPAPPTTALCPNVGDPRVRRTVPSQIRAIGVDQAGASRSLPVAVVAARATLNRATTFVSAGLGARCTAHTVRAGLAPPAKVVGNALRELDRFFQLLLDAVIASQSTISPASRRDTIGKIALLPVHGLVPRCDVERLQALRRSRDCLFHTGGLVSRADTRGGTTMTVGWPTPHGRPVAIGGRLRPSPRDLAGVCRFYEQLGDHLVTGLDPGAGS